MIPFIDITDGYERSGPRLLGNNRSKSLAVSVT